MLTSKERAELRSKATAIDTTLMVGKSGITDALIAETENQLDSRELVKGKVLEGAMMSPRSSPLSRRSLILALMLRSAEQLTPSPTGQLAPWRGRRMMRTS